MSWTIMVYAAGGANVSNEVRESMLRMKQIGSNNDIHLLVQFDPGTDPGSNRRPTTRRYALRHVGRAEDIRESLETLNAVTKSFSGPENADKVKDLTTRFGNDFSLFDVLPNELVGLVTNSQNDTLGDLITRLDSQTAARFRDDLLKGKPDGLKTLILNSVLQEDEVEDLGTTDTGDPERLWEFMEWCNTNYSADHRMVIIWGHGDGFSVAWDGTRSRNPDAGPRLLPNDKLRPTELHDAFAQTRPPIDVVGFNSCMMGMLDVYDVLLCCVRLVVASEGYTPKRGWPYEDILGALQREPRMDPRRLCTEIVTRYVRFYRRSEEERVLGIDLAACDLSEAGNLVRAVRGLVEQILDGLERGKDNGLADAILDARLNVQTYEDEYVDLDDFAYLLSEYSRHPEIVRACERVQDAVKAMVVTSQSTGDKTRNSSGISVYFPRTRVSGRYAYLDSEVSKWLQFLRRYRNLVEAKFVGAHVPGATPSKTNLPDP